MRRFTGIIVLILLLITAIVIPSGCDKNESENPTPPTQPSAEQPSNDDAVVPITYDQLVAEGTSTEKTPFSLVPGLFIRKLTKKPIDVNNLPPNVSYKDLDKYATPNISGGGSGGCTVNGTKTCGFRCGLKVLYIVTGIPEQCACYGYAGGMDIWCPGDCPSYELSCGDR